MRPGLTRTRLLGRAAELAAIERAIDGAVTGSGGLLLISGEPGIGRSTLAEATAEIAEARGCAVTWGRAWEGGEAPPNWTWSLVLRGLGLPIGVLDPTDPPADVARRVIGALTAASVARPITVLLDDLHDAGPEAALVLHGVARLVRGLPVLVVATFRSSVSRASEGTRETLAELASAHPHLRLRGLSAGDVAALLDELGQPGSERAARLHAAAGGNPLLVTLLARTASTSAGWQRPGDEPPEELRARVRLQLQDLPLPTRELLLVMAVLGRTTSVEEVAATAGMDEAAVRAALAPALSGDILSSQAPGSLRFRHDIVRDTVYADLAPVERANLHGRASEGVQQLGRDDPHARARAAHHAYHAAPGAADREMLEQLVVAAEDARRDGATSEAAALLAHAVHCADAEAVPAEERGRLLVELASAQEEDGQPEAAERSWQAALALARLTAVPGLLARAAVGTARSALSLGLATPQHVGALEEALEALGGEPSAARAEVLALLGAALYWTPERTRGIALTERSLEVAREVGDPTGLAAALLASHYVARGPGRAAGRVALAREAAEAADASGEVDLSVLARSALAVDHREVGEPDAVDGAVRELRRFADEHGHPGGRWAADVHDLVTALLAGEEERARALAAAAEGATGGARDLRYLTEFARVMTDLSPLAPTVRTRLRQRSRRLPDVVSWRARALLDDVERGEDVEAELGAIIALLRAPGRADAHWLLAAALTAEAVALLGDARRARILSELLLPHSQAIVVASRVGATRGVLRHHLGILALAVGDAPEAIRHLEAALEHQRLAGHAAHVPRTLEALDRARRVRPASDRSPLGTLAARGEGWVLERPAGTLTLPNVKGLRYLARLLGSPGEPIAALDLLRLDAGGGAREGGTPPLPLDRGGADAVLDETAKRAYRARIRAIDLALAGFAGDAVRRAALEAERAAVAAALAGGTGWRGRDRRLPSEAERARTSVTKALRGAVERLRTLDPEVASHLDRALTTGSRCTYSPDGPPLRVDA